MLSTIALLDIYVASFRYRGAKYSDEHVCLSVCLSVREDISGTARATFTDFCACCLCPWLGTSAGMLTIGRIAYRREGVTGVHSADEV